MGMFFDNLAITPKWVVQRIPITITGSADGVLTDYQVRVPMSYVVYFDADFSNVYFTDTDGVTEIDFWIDYCFDHDVAVFWVKVPSIAASPDTTTIYAYFNGTGVGVSSASGTFITGVDFDDGATTGLTINLAGSASSTTLVGSDLLGLKLGRAMKFASDVISLGGGGTWDDVRNRDMCILNDEVDGQNIKASDGLWAYYSGYSGSVWAIGLAKSTDGGLTWTKYGGNPVVSAAGSGWYQTAIFQPSVTKLSDGTYVMAAKGQDVSSIDSVGILTSTDGLTWADGDQKLTMSQFNDGGTAVDQMGVPRMILCKDGTWRMLLECITTGVTNGWKIYGATASSPTGIWTVMNSGSPVYTVTGTGWEEVGVANPTFIEVTPGNYLMAYNGIGDTGAAIYWQLGFASTTDFSSWTRNTDNPVVSAGTPNTVWDGGSIEAAFLSKDFDSTHIRVFYNGYTVSGANTRTGVVLLPQNKVLNLKDTAATADGWVAGIDLDSVTTFIAEAWLTQTTDTSNASNMQMSLMDSAAVPSPTTNTIWNAATRFQVARNSPSDATPNQFYIYYMDTEGGAHFWGGSEWVAEVIALYHDGEAKVIITDDGTNYKADIQSRINTTLIGTVASIAKTSVKAFSAGRALTIAEPFTNFFYNGQDVDNVIIRQYTANPPTVSVGSPE